MPVTILIRNNGPYFISPDQVHEVNLVDHEGNPVPIPGKSITLCRCGASTKKPFCDGTHSKIGFKGAEAAQAAYDAGQQGTGVAAPVMPPAAGSTPNDGTPPQGTQG